ncbi:hypothetical protein ACFFWC_10515 [Plantactinospora siamensis]|uniref:Uncharacterized protein n=1 Tax=Plantactinospora siamensis TaxID=555372 RepID=A0ABV6NUR3_9ACTN
MGLFRRRPKLPADRRPALAADERVLAWAEVGESGGGDGVVVATNRGLWLPDVAERPGWHELHKAVWSGRELAVTPATGTAERDGYLVVADAPVRTYLLLAPGDLPEQVRARLTRSVGYTVHHRLDRGGLRVVGRRVSGVDGLTWTVRYDPGTPADDPAVVDRTGELVAAARAAATPAGL